MLFLNFVKLLSFASDHNYILGPSKDPTDTRRSRQMLGQHP